MYKKLNNAGKNTWLQAQTANQVLNKISLTQDADDLQAFLSVIYDTGKG